MHDLDLTTLRLFVAACEQRNLARAGEQQHIGASAISKRLALLEQQVQVPLLERHRRGVLPTPAGKILLEHARTMLAAADRVARDMAAYRQGITGQALNYRTVVSTFDASLRCARAGLGVAVVPREVLDPAGDGGPSGPEGLRAVRLSDPWALRRFAICLRDAAQLSPAARLLLAHLEARAAGR